MERISTLYVWVAGALLAYGAMHLIKTCSTTALHNVQAAYQQDQATP